jgi:hypothetical protein
MPTTAGRTDAEWELFYANRRNRLAELLRHGAPKTIIEGECRLVLMALAHSPGHYGAIWKWLWYQLKGDVAMIPFNLKLWYWQHICRLDSGQILDRIGEGDDGPRQAKTGT